MGIIETKTKHYLFPFTHIHISSMLIIHYYLKHNIFIQLGSLFYNIGGSLVTCNVWVNNYDINAHEKLKIMV